MGYKMQKNAKKKKKKSGKTIRAKILEKPAHSGTRTEISVAQNLFNFIFFVAQNHIAISVYTSIHVSVHQFIISIQSVFLSINLLHMDAHTHA